MSKQLQYQHFDVIRHPLMTEKSNRATESNQVFFLVDRVANKNQIKLAVEHIYNVKVKAVNTATLPGKVKRFKGREGQQSNYKKAMVTLQEGHTIDLMGV